MAGEGSLIPEELKLCAGVDSQNTGESSVYQPNSKPSSSSYFLNAHLLNTLLLYHLQNVTLLWGLFDVCLLWYGHKQFLSSAWGHRNSYSSYTTAMPLTSWEWLPITASEIKMSKYAISLLFTINIVMLTGVVREGWRLTLVWLCILRDVQGILFLTENQNCSEKVEKSQWQNI